MTQLSCLELCHVEDLVPQLSCCMKQGGLADGPVVASPAASRQGPSPNMSCCMMQGGLGDGPARCKSSRQRGGMRCLRRPSATLSHRSAAASLPQTSNPRIGSWHPGAAAGLKASRMMAHSRLGQGGPCSALPAPASSKPAPAGRLRLIDDQHCDPHRCCC